MHCSLNIFTSSKLTEDRDDDLQEKSNQITLLGVKNKNLSHSRHRLDSEFYQIKTVALHYSCSINTH